MKKTILSVILTVMIMVLLLGCSNSNDSQQTVNYNIPNNMQLTTVTVAHTTQGYSMQNEVIKENINRVEDIDIKSIREGEIPGTHIVNFESNADIIKLEHEAKNREGFALGAVMAAEWIKGKKGFFTIEDMMKEIIK